MQVINNLLYKFVNWYFPQIKIVFDKNKAFNESYIKLNNDKNVEIEANKAYIKVLESRDKGMSDEIQELRKSLYCPSIPDKQEPIIKIRSQEGWHMITDLPNKSIPECIVSDGEVVQCVQYDHNTKQFLKTFGSQAMYVRKPVAWMPMPLPPAVNNGCLDDKRRASAYLANTYIR